MRTHRNLVLRKETLAELAAPELAEFGGGAKPLLSNVLCLAELRPSGPLINCDSLFGPCTYDCA